MVFVSDIPKLLAEWHPTLNGDMKPETTKSSIKDKVWWIGASCGHEWDASVKNRANGSRCPICLGRRLVIGCNDLATLNPSLASEWHPTLNGDLKPHQIAAKNGKKVWWRIWHEKCGMWHEWEAPVNTRSRGKRGDPYIHGHRVLSGCNDFASNYPEIASQWHPSKNGELEPNQVTAKNSKVVWWLAGCGHEWDMTIGQRTGQGQGCPFCSGARILVGDNDLATTHPKLATQWHPHRNGDLKPTHISHGSGVVIWLMCDLGHGWDGKPNDLKVTEKCPFCAGYRVEAGLNDLTTTHPELAARWHPTLNGDLTPDQVSFGSSVVVWWVCENGHEYDVSPNQLTSSLSGGSVCGFCSNHRVWFGDNDFFTNHSEFLVFWHSDNPDPKAVYARSTLLVKWLCAKGHVTERKICDFVDHPGCTTCKKGNSASLSEGVLADALATSLSDCYVVSSPQKIGRRQPDIGVVTPNGLLVVVELDGYRWHSRENHYAKDSKQTEIFLSDVDYVVRVRNNELPKIDGSVTVSHPWVLEIKNVPVWLDEVASVVADTIRKADSGHELSDVEIVSDIVHSVDGHRFSMPAGKAVEGRKMLKDFDVAAEWSDTNTFGLDGITSGSKIKYLWDCPKGHTYPAAPKSRTKKNPTGCPFCSGRLPSFGETDLFTTYPEVAAQWHPIKNVLLPFEVTAGSTKVIWWLCENGHEWDASPNARIKKRPENGGIPRIYGCSFCSGGKR